MISLIEHIELRDDSRRSKILAGATKVFLAYGFQRTTMDDIARAAEISRPALYVLFRNKTDIYRALASEFLEQVVVLTRKTLDCANTSLDERIREATTAFTCLLAEVEESPHGLELLDMQNSLASDIVSAGREQLVQMFTDAIDAEMRASGRDLAASGLSASGLAYMLLDAIDGMKMRRPAREEQEVLHAQYIAALAAILKS